MDMLKLLLVLPYIRGGICIRPAGQIQLIEPLYLAHQATGSQGCGQGIGHGDEQQEGNQGLIEPCSSSSPFARCRCRGPTCSHAAAMELPRQYALTWKNPDPWAGSTQQGALWSRSSLGCKVSLTRWPYIPGSLLPSPSMSSAPSFCSLTHLMQGN